MRIFKPGNKPILNIIRKSIKINFCDFWEGFHKEENCYTRILKKYYNVEISDEPDFLFYSCFGEEFKKYQNSVKIFVTGENVIPDFNKCDYATGFNDIIFKDRYLRFNMFYGEIKNKRKTTKDLLNRKFCNFVYSNSSLGEGAIIRQDFFRKLSEYKHIDAPGKVCNNMQNAINPLYDESIGISKLDFIKNYKFTIAFENSKTPGYTTEKIFEPLQVLSIPIYWGNPDIVKDINPKSFINCNDYDDFDGVIKKVIELDNDDKKYLNMLKEKPIPKNSHLRKQKSEFEKFLVNIIEKGNNPLVNPLHNIDRSYPQK